MTSAHAVISFAFIYQFVKTRQKVVLRQFTTPIRCDLKAQKGVAWERDGNAFDGFSGDQVAPQRSNRNS